jgi:predicted enzyme related to lactoylglutathione lyase
MGQPVTHWQIVTKNPDRLAEFYAKLFGWESHADNRLGYRMIDTGSERGINGGIWPAPPEAPGFVQLFVEVDDVAAAAREAASLGAKVIVPPQKLPDGDEIAILHDPEGIPFGLQRSAED